MVYDGTSIRYVSPWQYEGVFGSVCMRMYVKVDVRVCVCWDYRKSVCVDIPLKIEKLLDLQLTQFSFLVCTDVK